MSRITTFALILSCAAVMLAVGCGTASSGLISGITPTDFSGLASLADLSDIPALANLASLAGIPPSALASLVQSNAVQIVVVNETASTLVLVITVDGKANTLTCPPAVSSRFALIPAPTEVRLISENQLDSAGQIVGGRNFAGVDAYSFLAGSFHGGSTLVWRFTGAAVEAQVL